MTAPRRIGHCHDCALWRDHQQQRYGICRLQDQRTPEYPPMKVSSGTANILTLHDFGCRGFVAKEAATA